MRKTIATIDVVLNKHKGFEPKIKDEILTLIQQWAKLKGSDVIDAEIDIKTRDEYLSDVDVKYGVEEFKDWESCNYDGLEDEEW